MSQAKGLSTWFIFSKNQLLVSLTFAIILSLFHFFCSLFLSFFQLQIGTYQEHCICHLPLQRLNPSFPAGSNSKESTCNAGDLGLIPELGRPPRGGHGNHSSILDKRIPKDGGAWWAAKNQTQLSN